MITDRARVRLAPVWLASKWQGHAGLVALWQGHKPRIILMPHILLVEDSKFVSDAVKDTLEEEGWRVETCADGFVAALLLHRETRYDLIILDNELPNVNGLELARRVRSLEHRQRTPIIMLSATECRRDARLAGVNEFLRKPQDIGKIVETVALLLERSS